MSKKKKERQQQWRQQNGIVGEVSLSPSQLFLLNEMIRKMSVKMYRDMINFTFFKEPSGAFSAIDDELMVELHEKTRSLTLLIQTNTENDKRSEAEYCG